MSSSVSERAFAVYCDEVVRDTVEKNEALRQENEPLEPLQSLCSIRINHDGDLLKEINLMEMNNEEFEQDENYLVLAFHDIPRFLYKDLYLFTVSICGTEFHRNTLAALRPSLPTLTVLWDTETPSAELVFHLTGEIRVTGILTEFKGTLENLQELVDNTNQFTGHYTNIGLVNMRTGQPVRNYFGLASNALDGAIFTMTKIEIPKKVVESVISCSMATPDTITSSDQVQDLQILVDTNDSHEQLRIVAKEYKTLVSRNAILKSCRSLVDSIVVENPVGSPTRFSLEAGASYPNINPNTAEWSVTSLTVENSSVPLTSIGRLEIRVAGVPWSLRSHIAQFTQEPTLLVVRYDNGISAIFCFNDSITESDIEAIGDNFLDHVHDIVMQPSERDECEWTMRLLGIHFPLHQVKTHLNHLGVDTTSFEDK